MKQKINVWHVMLIVLVTLVLSLSALPSFYGTHQVLVIETKTNEKDLPSGALSLVTELSKSLGGLPISISTETTQINPNQKSNSLVAKSIVIKSMSEQYGVHKLRDTVRSHLTSDYTLRIEERQSSPTWLTKAGFTPIKLGLDLHGGVLFVLQVDIDVALQERMQGFVNELKQSIQQQRLFGIKVASTEQGHIVIEHLNPQQSTELVNLLQKFDALQVLNKNNKRLVLAFLPKQQALFTQQLMQQSLDIMRTRIASLGITEAAVFRQGAHQIRIELPGIKNPAQAQKIIGSTATLGVYAMANTQGDYHKAMFDATQTLYNHAGQAVHILSKPIFAGVNIHSASAGVDENGLPIVNLLLDSQGGKLMSRFSKDNIGKPMVTVLSEYKNDSGQANQLQKHSTVINVATIQTHLGNRFSITNMPSPEAAKELATLIRAGSLNAPISIEERRTIDASLGAENVSKGFTALVIGLGLTMTFMLMWYRRLGVIANASLLVNLVCLLGLMACLPGIVLTLPGIAGLVLTVGMAVDTNVLVFERIKQEAKHVKRLGLASEAAYKKALTTILDANLTTLICALILYAMGNGPIKGFAITLSLGILTSLFSGVFVARTLTRIFNAFDCREQGA